MSSPSVGDAVIEHIDLGMQQAREQKANLESRGFSMITTAGGLTTLLLAIFGFLKDVNPESSGQALFRIAILVACSSFIIASLFGVLVAKPGDYAYISSASLAGMLTEQEWRADGAEARRNLCLASFYVLEDWTRMNRRKARSLGLSASFQILGIFCVGIALVFRILGS